MKRTSLILLLLAAACLFAAPAAAGQRHTIPFEITDSGHLVVDLTVNGTSREKAILDTGATFPIVDEKAADRVGLQLEEVPRMVEIIGLGATRTFPVLEVDQLSFGDVDLSGVDTAYNTEFTLPGARNVIPSSSIPLRTLDFDFERMRLQAYDRKPLGAYRSVTSRLPVTWIETLPFIPVSVNGKDGLALIDTGANVTFINSVFAETVARSPKAFRTVELIGSTGKVIPLRILSSRRFELGDFEVRQFDVIVSDAEFMKAFGIQDQPVMVLGLDILKNFRLQIDREDDEVWISKKSWRNRSAPGLTLYNDR